MTHTKSRRLRLAALAFLGTASIIATSCSSPASDGAIPEVVTATEAGPATAEGDQMRVTLLGTASPVLNSRRMGPATLVQAGGLNLVFDAGRGATLRLQQAGIPLGSIDGTFLTHFHSDHVNGLPDLWLTGFIPAFGGREGSFDVYGPTGTAHIANGLADTYDQDIKVRVADGEVKPETTKIVGHDFEHDGVVFDRNGVKVTMFEVQHDPKHAIEPAVGYRVDYRGHSALFSGDTIPVDNILKYGAGVDVMVHEVADFADRSKMATVFAHHTSPQQAGTIFAQTKPKMAVYSHIVNGIPGRVPGISEQELVDRTRETYQGPLTVGRDLNSFLITSDGVKATTIEPDNQYDN